MDEDHDKKLWFSRRYRLFSRYDEGIKISESMWFSVTPEEVALAVAQQVKTRWPNATTVIDICGGAGGNSIAFARAGFNVIYVDINPQVLQDAAHNAQVYECRSIEFHLGDAMELDFAEIADPATTVVHASPEWGGPSYKDARVFDVNDCGPPVGGLVHKLKSQGFKDLVMYLPRKSSLEQLQRLGAVATEDIFLTTVGYGKTRARGKYRGRGTYRGKNQARGAKTQVNTQTDYIQHDPDKYLGMEARIQDGKKHLALNAIWDSQVKTSESSESESTSSEDDSSSSDDEDDDSSDHDDSSDSNSSSSDDRNTAEAPSSPLDIEDKESFKILSSLGVLRKRARGSFTSPCGRPLR